MMVMSEPVSMTPVVDTPSIFTSTQWDSLLSVIVWELVCIIMLAPVGLLVFWVEVLVKLSVFCCCH